MAVQGFPYMNGVRRLMESWPRKFRFDGANGCAVDQGSTGRSRRPWPRPTSNDWFEWILRMWEDPWRTHTHWDPMTLTSHVKSQHGVNHRVTSNWSQNITELYKYLKLFETLETSWRFLVQGEVQWLLEFCDSLFEAQGVNFFNREMFWLVMTRLYGKEMSITEKDRETNKLPIVPIPDTTVHDAWQILPYPIVLCILIKNSVGESPLSAQACFDTPV